MNIKGLILSLGIGSVSVAAQATPEPAPQDNKQKTELKTYQDTIKTASIDSTYDFTADTSDVKTKIRTYTDNPEQWSRLSAREKILSCSDQIMLFLTSVEDVRANVYVDRTGRQRTPTVGIGFTHIDGKKIPKGYKIHSMENMVRLWNSELPKWVDNMDTYLGPAIDLMCPKTEKELLQCKSALCGWFSIQWQNGPLVLGTKDSPSPLVKAYTNFLQTGDSIEYHKAETLFKRWCKVTKRNKRGKPIKDKNGNIIKEVVPSFVARRSAEWDNIRGYCIITVGPRPESLKDDTTSQYMDILETVVGSVPTIKNRKTGELPKDWVQKAKEVKGDTVTIRYQQEFPELKQAPQNDKKAEEDTNPLILFFRRLGRTFN